MKERARFVLEASDGWVPISELCLRYGISRKVGYKWLKRYEEGGLSALADQSRAPRLQALATRSELVSRIVALRQQHPTWGPRKLRARLQRLSPRESWPATSTIGAILRREGLSKPRRRTRLSPGVWQSPRTPADAPNRVWTADFKGEFRLGNGRLCYPLTIVDGFSRYLLGCHALPGTATAGARAGFERVFRRYGLPDVIRTDNGVPFSTRAVGGLSHLAVWWIRLGIRLERIRPGHPEENGSHERMHRTLKAEGTRPPAATPALQQRTFRRFQKIYNEQRPHEALDLKPPAALYQHAERRMPKRLPVPEYPEDFQERRINHHGQLCWGRQYYFLSETLSRQKVGLQFTDEGIWNVFFGHALLAKLNERERVIDPLGGRLARRKAVKKVYTMCPV